MWLQSKWFAQSFVVGISYTSPHWGQWNPSPKTKVINCVNKLLNAGRVREMVNTKAQLKDTQARQHSCPERKQWMGGIYEECASRWVLKTRNWRTIIKIYKYIYLTEDNDRGWTWVGLRSNREKDNPKEWQKKHVSKLTQTKYRVKAN